MKRVEIMAPIGCPSLGTTLQRVRSAIMATGVATEITVVHVGRDEEAGRRGMLCLPTVRVDGVDVHGAAMVWIAAALCLGLPARVVAPVIHGQYK